MFSKRKKGQMRMLVFISFFFAMTSIIGSLFVRDMIDRTVTENTDSKMIGILGLTDSIMSDIPVIGFFWDIIVYNIAFAYIHPYLALLYGSLIGAPLGYLVLRLARGGG